MSEERDPLEGVTEENIRNCAIRWRNAIDCLYSKRYCMLQGGLCRRCHEGYFYIDHEGDKMICPNCGTVEHSVIPHIEQLGEVTGEHYHSALTVLLNSATSMKALGAEPIKSEELTSLTPELRTLLMRYGYQVMHSTIVEVLKAAQLLAQV